MNRKTIRFFASSTRSRTVTCCLPELIFTLRSNNFHGDSSIIQISAKSLLESVVLEALCNRFSNRNDQWLKI
ncbi:hypothetical protein HanRHA438_Chr16g0739161 [Helianthus annuus]|nr:hypothetical protein HanRHA438_Chr16g0739161 [Helianthus annuus]